MKTRIFFYEKGFFKSACLPVPVISIGNITTGGTGKTPVSEYIASYLKKRGKNPAIISRGYAAHIRHKEESTSEKICNDEQLLFHENIPQINTIVNKDRVKGCIEAVNSYQADCLLLDDGFQHLRLKRDLNIVLIDALEPFGYGYVLPRGLLREPVEGLKRADIFLITHTDQICYDTKQSIINRLREIAPEIPILESVHKPKSLESANRNETLEIDYLKGKKGFAFCAIGNPLSFKKSLINLGTKLLGFYEFPDHHVYSSSELKKLNENAKGVSPDIIIITQKDRVKIDRYHDIWDFPLWTLKMEIVITKGAEFLEERLYAIMNQM